MQRIRLLVFDLDGTLIDSSRDLAAAVNATLAALAPSAAPIPLDDVRSFIGDGARTLVARSLRARAAATPVDVALPLFLDAYRARLLDTTCLYPGVAETLAALGPRSALAVLSNKPGDLSREILQGLAVDGSFARIYGGGDVARKPDPGGLLKLMQELHASPAATLMVGDSANDVRTGRAAGVRTVGVRYGFDCSRMEAERPDVVIDAFGELVELVAQL